MASKARTWVNRHQGVVALIAIILLGGSAWFVTWRYQPKPPPPSGKAYYYDTVTRTYFIDEPTRPSPFTTTDGHVAVRANFFSCGNCTEKTAEEGGERFLGYYEKSEEAASANPPASAAGQFQAPLGGKLISVDGETWVPSESPEGYAISSAVHTRCARPVELRYGPPPGPVAGTSGKSSG